MAKNKRISTQIDTSKMRIFCIVSKLPIHRLAWILNREFDWSLYRYGNILGADSNYTTVSMDAKADESHEYVSFPLHIFKEEDGKYDVDLIYNKSERGSFISELKQFDYIILLKGEFDYLPSAFLDRIKKVQDIQLVTEVPTQKIKEQHILLSYR